MKMMKPMILSLAVLSLSACASKAPKPKYMDEKNEAKFARKRTLAEPPEKVLRGARAVLDELTRESDPQASDVVKTEGSSVFTGWVHGLAKDKYVQYDYNGTPRRKQLGMRRIYSFTVSPALAGSEVEMNVKEELQEIDLKTGENKGWKRVDADPAAYDLLLRRLREKVRSE